MIRTSAAALCRCLHNQWTCTSLVRQLLPPYFGASGTNAAQLHTSACRRLNVTDVRRFDATDDDEQGKKLKWLDLNKKVFSPTLIGEEPRKAYVCHVLKNVKYSRKKMWYVASLIRGLSVEAALDQLRYVKMKGSLIAARAIEEAQHMAVEEHNVEFKTNMWVAESFATKAMVVRGLRRHARGRPGDVRYGYIHYFLRLEEGQPPQQYYQDADPSPQEMLARWMQEKDNRRIIHTL